MKKIALILAAVMIALSFTACADDKTAPQTTEALSENDIIIHASAPAKPEEAPFMLGVFDSGVSWSLYEDGTLFIDGLGAMPEWTSVKDAPWRDKIYTIKTVCIGDGVTAVGSFAFANAINLTAVYLPGTVTKIGSSAFRRCEKLCYVSVPSGVTEIGSSAFSSCFALTHVSIPESVVSLGDKCFAGWGEGQKITIRNTESFVTENWNENWKSGCSAEIIMN